jgi:general stress protein CsbA
LAFFGDGSEAAPDESAVASLLYPCAHRGDPPDAVVYHPPEEGIEGGSWLSANATVTAGHRPLLDNAFVLSAVLAVGAATRLREIRAAAYAAVGEYRAADLELRSTQASRRFLEGLASRLGDLEAELAFAVDAATDAGAVLPYRPLESYHRTLVRALDTSRRAMAVGRILSRLAQGAAAELVAVASAEWRIEERRRALWNGFAWILALVGIPAAIALGYASRTGGYADNDDIRAYIIAGIVAVVLVIGYVVAASTVRRRTRRRHRY